LHQRIAAEDDAAIGGEQIEQIEFVRRQFDLMQQEPPTLVVHRFVHIVWMML